ncbi:Aste57867_2546 [Aphanomyces stellatus]|uniref:Aste57867_2546 protein n=1 Tax=Aphanomyces stellatus TaxID=120398 RepID=A0A485K7V3_9STRA|nr:hypothetical protein As57867_002539 [Aphanomyces stellatus]VFT79743.1 Aste57867_2546 [Aphanomyces stellatus]
MSYSDVEVAAERGHVAVLEYLVDGDARLRQSQQVDGTYFGLTPKRMDTFARLNVADAAERNGCLAVADCLMRHGAPNAGVHVWRRRFAMARVYMSLGMMSIVELVHVVRVFVLLLVCGE